VSLHIPTDGVGEAFGTESEQPLCPNSGYRVELLPGMEPPCMIDRTHLNADITIVAYGMITAR
jgi:hypothetical protein